MDRGTQLTSHALGRLDQRGFRVEDLDLLALLGRPVEGGLFVCQKDAKRVADSLRQVAERCERLAGCRVVLNGNVIVTAYRPGRRKTRHLIRNSEERNLEGTWP